MLSCFATARDKDPENPDLKCRRIDMRKWLPIILGLGCGAAVGVFLLFCPSEWTPSFICEHVLWMGGVLRRAFLPNSDPMAVLFFEIPLIVLYFTLIGGIVGLAVSLAAWLSGRKGRPDAG